MLDSAVQSETAPTAGMSKEGMGGWPIQARRWLEWGSKAHPVTNSGWVPRASPELVEGLAKLTWKFRKPNNLIPPEQSYFSSQHQSNPASRV